MKRTASADLVPLESQPSRLRNRVAQLFSECGIEIGGANPWDIQVSNEDFFSRVMADGSLGLGESYVDGWWNTRDLDGFVYRLLKGGAREKVGTWRDAFAWLHASLFNLQRKTRAFEVGEKHYDLGNELYEGMLDERMIYSCGYWEDASTLAEAQVDKLELVFRKLDLQPGQRVLDVGCGWGGALKYAAETYDVTGVGVTIAREQADYARRSCEGLPITIRLQDYRELPERAAKEPFDNIWSIGMFEHVGVRNYRGYMDVVRRCLKDGGRFLLHTIGGHRSTNHTDPWIHKYIFPNSMLPSQLQIVRAIEGLFTVVGWQAIGSHYERTLLAWRANFESYWARIGARDERFRRMWNYYLSASAAAFRAKRIDVWQVLLAPL
jgi:cyclopropane-fatty-acyl-phospholipid synthase